MAADGFVNLPGYGELGLSMLAGSSGKVGPDLVPFWFPLVAPRRLRTAKLGSGLLGGFVAKNHQPVSLSFATGSPGN